MVNTKVGKYPGRARRMTDSRRKKQEPQWVTKCVYGVILALFLSIAVLLTVMWGVNRGLDGEIEAAKVKNELLSDNLEAAQTELKRSQSYDEVSQRANEMGLSPAESSNSVEITQR